jgi:hypothetical protein
MSEFDQLNARLEGVRDAMQRGRAAIFLTSLASLACLLAVWNNYFSWDRLVFESTHEKNRIADLKESSAAVPSELRGVYKTMDELAGEELVRNYVDNQKLSLSVIGMSVSSGDLLILGSVAMFMLSVYYFLCARRSNHEMGSLLVEATSHSKEYWRYVYFGIRSCIVFNVLSHGDAPYTELHHPAESSHPVMAVRRTVRALAYMPSITIGFAFASDVLYALQVRRGRYTFGQLDRPFQVQLLAGLFVGILFLILTWRLNLNSNRFTSNMKTLMQKFRGEYTARFHLDIFTPISSLGGSKLKST